MHKGNKVTRIMIIVAGLLVLLIAGVIMFYMTRPRNIEINKGGTTSQLMTQMKTEMIENNKSYIENQVIAVADSKREAKKIAEAIGGTLLSYDNQVAVIQIGVTVEEMMQMLEEDPSLPKVSPNYQNYTTQ